MLRQEAPKALVYLGQSLRILAPHEELQNTPIRLILGHRICQEHGVHNIWNHGTANRYKIRRPPTVQIRGKVLMFYSRPCFSHSTTCRPCTAPLDFGPFLWRVCQLFVQPQSINQATRGLILTPSPSSFTTGFSFYTPINETPYVTLFQSSRRCR